MENKHIVTIFLTALLLAPVSVSAFSVFGYSMSDLWNTVTFWSDNEDSSVKSKDKTSLSTVENINLANKTYSKKDAKSIISGSEEYKSYVKSFNYECIYLETNKNKSYSFTFNTSEGTMKEIYDGKACDRRIYIEESLIKDFREEGFKKSKVPSYMKRLDLPAGMKIKALKVLGVNN